MGGGSGQNGGSRAIILNALQSSSESTALKGNRMRLFKDLRVKRNHLARFNSAKSQQLTFPQTSIYLRIMLLKAKKDSRFTGAKELCIIRSKLGSV